MSSALLLVVGVIYASAGISAVYEGRYWLALMLVCYSIANYALIRMQ